MPDMTDSWDLSGTAFADVLTQAGFDPRNVSEEVVNTLREHRDVTDGSLDEEAFLAAVKPKEPAPAPTAKAPSIPPERRLEVARELLNDPEATEEQKINIAKAAAAAERDLFHMGPSTFQGVSDDDLAEKLDKLTEARQNALAAASQEHRANPGNRKSLKLNEEAIRLATEAAGIEEELGRRQAMRGVDEHIIRTAQEAARAELDRENADLVAQWRELTAKNPKDAAAAAGLANALSRAVPGSGLYEQDLNQRVEKMLASVKATIEGGTDAQTKLWADAMREMDEMAKTSRLRARQAGGVDM